MNTVYKLIRLLVFVSLQLGCEVHEPKKGVGLLIASLVDERWEKDRDFLIEKFNELGVSLYIEEADNNNQKQYDQAIKLIDEKQVQVLIIVPVNSDSSSRIVNYAHSKGVITIAYDRLINNCPLDYYVSFNNFEVGRLQAENILKYMQVGNMVLINGPIYDNNSNMLRKGQMSVLMSEVKSKKINIIADTYLDNWSEELANEYMKKLLMIDNVNIGGIICGNDAIARGVIRALHESYFLHDYPIVGQDADLLNLKSIINGHQTLTIYKPIRKLTFDVASLAYSICTGNGIKSGDFIGIDNGNKKVASILQGVVVINKQNMFNVLVTDEYLDINQLDLLLK